MAATNLDDLPTEILVKIGRHADSQADIDSLYAVNTVLRTKLFSVKHESVALAISPPLEDEDPYEVASRSLYVDRYGLYDISKHQIGIKTWFSTIHTMLSHLWNIILLGKPALSAIKPLLTKNLVVLPAHVATAAGDPSLSPRDYRKAVHDILRNPNDWLLYTALHSFKWSCGKDLELGLLASLCSNASNIKRLEINSRIVSEQEQDQKQQQSIASKIASELQGLRHLGLVFDHNSWVDNSVTLLVDRTLLPLLQRGATLNYGAVFGTAYGMAIQPKLVNVNDLARSTMAKFSQVSTVTELHLSGLHLDSASLPSRLSPLQLTHVDLDGCYEILHLIELLSVSEEPLPLTNLSVRNIQAPPRQHSTPPYLPCKLDRALNSLLQLSTKLRILTIDRADNDRMGQLHLKPEVPSGYAFLNVASTLQELDIWICYAMVDFEMSDHSSYLRLIRMCPELRLVTLTLDSAFRGLDDKHVRDFIHYTASLSALTKLKTVRLRIVKSFMPEYHTSYLDLRRIAIGNRLYHNKGEAAYEDEHYVMICWYLQEVYQESVEAYAAKVDEVKNMAIEKERQAIVTEPDQPDGDLCDHYSPFTNWMARYDEHDDLKLASVVPRHRAHRTRSRSVDVRGL